MSTASAPRSGRPSGLAAVGYGMTAVGFVQVAVTIAPQVAAMIPAAGGAAPAVGVAVALAADVVWAAPRLTTIHAYKSGQRAAGYGFGAATAVAVAVFRSCWPLSGTWAPGRYPGPGCAAADR